MPALSSLFTKFLFRETLTTQDKTDIRADIAAGTVATTESTVALLATANLAPASIVIPQFGVSQVPANRAIGLNQAGQIAVGNGVAVQGNAAFPTTRTFKGITLVNLSGKPKAGAFFRVVAMPLTALEMVAGARIYVSGTVTYKPVNSFVINQLVYGLAFDQQSTLDKTNWQNVESHPTGADINIVMDRTEFFGVADVGPGGTGNVIMDLALSSVSGQLHIYGDGSDAITTNGGLIFAPVFTDEVPEGVANNIWPMIQIGQTGAGNFGSIDVALSYDLSLRVVVP